MCANCEADRFLESVKEMINDEDHRFSWAFDTLNGIKQYIENSNHITPGQSKAVTNIERAACRKRGCG